MSRRLFPEPKEARWRTGNDRSGFDIASDDRARANHSVFSNAYAGHDESPSADKRISSDCYFSCDERQVGSVQIMRSGAKVSFLRNYTAATKLDFTERIQVRAISDARPIVENDTPWRLYASPLMNEGFPVDLASKYSEP
jgi:hypothetical protein